MMQITQALGCRWIESTGLVNLVKSHPAIPFSFDQESFSRIDWPFWSVSCCTLKVKNCFVKRITAYLPLQDPDLFLDAIAIPCKEPNTLEKLSLMQFGKKIDSNFAIEVFPEKEALVDEANMYHFWLIEKPENIFPFSIHEVYSAPQPQDWEYHPELGTSLCHKTLSTPFGAILFLYIKTDKYIKWQKKQFIKDQLYGPETNGIEIISPQAVNMGYECIILLPYKYSLPFGFTSRVYPQ